jgi:hypothetical protein
VDLIFEAFVENLLDVFTKKTADLRALIIFRIPFRKTILENFSNFLI